MLASGMEGEIQMHHHVSKCLVSVPVTGRSVGTWAPESGLKEASGPRGWTQENKNAD